MNRLGPLTILLSALVVCVYGVTAYHSFGYDDEYFNIRIIEGAKSYGELAALANSGDVHPPGQYLAGKFLFDLLGDWSRVRAAIAVMVAASLIALWRCVEGRSWQQRLFSYVAIMANPALLMWGTGLRWYAFFIIVTNLIVLMMLRRSDPTFLYWGVVALGSLILFHLSYVALVLVPVIWLVALVQRQDRRVGIILTLVVLLLTMPQLKVFFDVHLNNADTQFSRDALFGLVVHLLANQGAWPVSAFGIALIVANVLLLFAAARHGKSLLQRSEVLLLGLGAVGLLVTHLSGKIRNVVTLASLQGLVQSTIFARQPNGWLKGVIFALLAVGNIGACYNVIAHTNTTKGGWNTPYGEVLAAFAAKTASCPRTVAVAYDAVLLYHLKTRAEVIDVASDEQWARALRPTTEACVVVLETFRGSLFPPTWADFREALRQRSDPREVQRFGLDSYAWFKRLVDKDVPDHYVTMTVFRPR